MNRFWNRIAIYFGDKVFRICSCGRPQVIVLKDGRPQLDMNDEKIIGYHHECKCTSTLFTCTKEYKRNKRNKHKGDVMRILMIILAIAILVVEQVHADEKKLAGLCYRVMAVGMPEKIGKDMYVTEAMIYGKGGAAQSTWVFLDIAGTNPKVPAFGYDIYSTPQVLKYKDKKGFISERSLPMLKYTTECNNKIKRDIASGQ